MHFFNPCFNYFFENSECFSFLNINKYKQEQTNNELIAKTVFERNIPIINRLNSKAKTLENIIEINEEISKLEIEIENAKEKIFSKSKEGTSLLGDTLDHTISQTHLQKLQILKDGCEKQISAFRQNLPTAEEEQFSTIFNIEYQLRNVLKIDFPNKKKYQDLYDQAVIPLLRQTKSSILKSPLNFSAHAAAAKGKGLQAGLHALKILTQSNGVVTKKTSTSQNVFLFPKEGVVFKNADKIAEEEERTVNALFDLMSKQAVTGNFKFKRTSLERFGINTPLDIKKRGFTPDCLSTALRQKLLMRLSMLDVQVLKAYEKKIVGESSSPAYVIPNLSNQNEKEAYEICEQCKWKFVDKDGVKQVVDFKTFHTLTLTEEDMQEIEPLSPNISVSPTPDQIQRALNVGWKIVSPELLTRSSNVNISEIQNIQAKPFVDRMILLNDLDHGIRDVVLKRLNADSQFNAILTAELQLLDLHSNNLGVEPEINSEYEYYENFRFTLPQNENKTFKELLFAYLKGQITPDTLISFEEQGKLISKKLNDLPELQKALDIHWKLVIFDGDVCLSEDNRMHEIIFKTVPGHLIPLRSVLLETNWKDHPLSKEVIQHLMDSEERDLRVKQWLAKEDAPIYKQLSDDVVKEVKKRASKFVNRVSLSHHKRRHSYPTIHSLSMQFANDFSKVDKPEYLEIWKFLEQELSQVFVYPHDTWETIAQRTHQDVAVLQSLNPQGLHFNKKIKIQYDLTSLDDQALERRKKIAAQLFPRLTFRQQEAFIERQKNRKKYLKDHQDFFGSTLEGQPLLTQIENYLKESTTPLSSLRREQLLEELNQRKQSFLNQPQALSDFKAMICSECQPTYFNLAKAIYPLLADAYELNKAAMDQEAEMGRSIGLPSKSIESIIQDIKIKFAANSPEVQLAERFEKKMANVKNAAFFSEFS